MKKTLQNNIAVNDFHDTKLNCVIPTPSSVIILIHSYFIYISQGSVETNL